MFDYHFAYTWKSWSIWGQLNAIEAMNESNEVNEMNESNEMNGMSELNEMNEMNESNEMNEMNESNEPIKSQNSHSISPLWVELDHRSSSTFSQQISLYSFALQGPRYPYRRYRIAITGTRLHLHSFEENFGWQTTWFPEFFPFLTLSRFSHAVFYSDKLPLYYNVEFSVQSLFSEEELNAEKVSFHIEPELPQGVVLNHFTGELSGVFVFLQRIE